VSSTAVLLLLALVPGGIRFLGEPRCPEPEAVEAQLRLIDPDLLDGPARQLVLLESQPNGLRARLYDGHGHLIEERVLAGPKSCAQWAQITAALLSSWETELARPELPLSALAGATAQPLPPPDARAASPAGATSPPAVPPTPTIHPPPATGPEISAAQPIPPSSSSRWEGEIGVGVSGAVASVGGFAPGLDVETSLTPHALPLGGDLTLSWIAPRSFPAQDGTAHWQRFTLGVGGHFTLGQRALRLELEGAFLAGLLNSYGTGFTPTTSSSDFDPGIGLGVRARWAFARSWLAWLRLGASFWLKSEEVQLLSGSTAVFSSQVPSVDLSATLGFSRTGEL
jgi:hypothetical protein